MYAVRLPASKSAMIGDAVAIIIMPIKIMRGSIHVNFDMWNSLLRWE